MFCSSQTFMHCERNSSLVQLFSDYIQSIFFGGSTTTLKSQNPDMVWSWNVPLTNDHYWWLWSHVYVYSTLLKIKNDVTIQFQWKRWKFQFYNISRNIVTRNGKTVWKQGQMGRSTHLCWEPSYTRTHSSLPCVKI